MLPQPCSLSLTLVDTATNITADSESRTTISYRWSVVTFSLSNTVFDLFAIFLIMVFPISGLHNWCFLPLMSPKMGFGAPHDLDAWGRKSVKNITIKNITKKTQVVYISPHRPDDRRRVAN